MYTLRVLHANRGNGVCNSDTFLSGDTVHGVFISQLAIRGCICILQASCLLIVDPTPSPWPSYNHQSSPVPNRENNNSLESRPYLNHVPRDFQVPTKQ